MQRVNKNTDNNAQYKKLKPYVGSVYEIDNAKYRVK